MVKAAAEVGVEDNAKEEEIAPSSTSVLRGRTDQTVQMVRHELDHCTASVAAQIVDWADAEVALGPALGKARLVAHKDWAAEVVGLPQTAGPSCPKALEGDQEVAGSAGVQGLSWTNSGREDRWPPGAGMPEGAHRSA